MNLFSTEVMILERKLRIGIIGLGIISDAHEVGLDEIRDKKAALLASKYVIMEKPMTMELTGE